ncbi:MAG: type II toxin-antitoxin system VapB family antitoxin [Bosea sp.]|jgi:antitoxin VapB|nr:type II toxin-antitoxin system VapB family antitoxin [Bosea sp. (in: a-proteobacteria)]
MPLNIRDPRAAELARDLARRRGTTMTQAIIGALEAEIERERAAKPLAERLLAIANHLHAKARPGGRRMTRDEIDDLWGQ